MRRRRRKRKRTKRKRRRGRRVSGPSQTPSQTCMGRSIPVDYRYITPPSMYDSVTGILLEIRLLCPRPVGGGIKRSSASVVRLSDVAYIGSNSKTKRPRKTKLCTGVPQVTCDSHTDFKVKRSKVKVTRRGHIVAAT